MVAGGKGPREGFTNEEHGEQEPREHKDSESDKSKCESKCECESDACKAEEISLDNGLEI